MPVDVEGGGVAGPRAVLQDVAPPAVQGLADPHVIGDRVEHETQAVRPDGIDEPGEVFLGAEIGVQDRMVDDVVAMFAARHGPIDRREVTVADAERAQVGHDFGDLRKGKSAVQLQPVGGQGQRRRHGWRNGRRHGVT